VNQCFVYTKKITQPFPGVNMELTDKQTKCPTTEFQPISMKHQSLLTKAQETVKKTLAKVVYT
jgi:hypothetical protein